MERYNFNNQNLNETTTPVSVIRPFEFKHGRKNLAERIRNIDPFMHNLEGIREQVAEFVDEDLKLEMKSPERSGFPEGKDR